MTARASVRPLWTAALALLLTAGDAARVTAQVTGTASVMVDVFPDLGAEPGRQRATEVRARLTAERRDDIGDHLRIVLAGAVDGLVGDRPGAPGAVRDAILQPIEAYAEGRWSAVDLRVGMSRIVWGRLDEFQPTDVVNPIDLTRFLLEGRSEARLPVGLVRARLFLPASTTVEALVVPIFRRGRFDQLDEPTSPFDIRPGRVVRIDEAPEGADAWQGGARLTTTTGRVDWGASVYRGVRTFAVSTLRLVPDVAPEFALPQLVDRYPRFTMIGADFETVRGSWGVRGELAAFVDDELQAVRAVQGVPGRSVEAGLGVDRKAGDYRLAANVLWRWTGVDADDPRARPFVGDPDLEGTDLTLVAAADRSFARETRRLRVFTAYDPADRTVFARAIGAVSLSDDVWLEASGGLFGGTADDTLGRLTRRDFVYARLKVSF